MTIAGSDPEREEITVRFPDGVLDRLDESCQAQGYANRSEFVTDALSRAVENDE